MSENIFFLVCFISPSTRYIFYTDMIVSFPSRDAKLCRVVRYTKLIREQFLQLVPVTP